jgi:4-amino-4-deoxy-L-arabinose transferase-like glycosyltransferase
MKRICNFLQDHSTLAIWLGVIIAAIPVIIFRDFTPDNELRYLSIADEAIANGHCFAFYNQGVAYADKPPLYLWIVMLGKLILGKHCMWFLALFSLIPALIIMTVMDRWIGEEMTADNRLTARLMLMTTGLFIGLALTLRMDMLMCMFITLALRTFYRIYIGKGSHKDQWLFPLYIFLAVFSKGPIGILVPLLTSIIFLAIKRDLRSIGRYWGWKTWAVLVPLCALWFGAVFAEGGTEYLNNLLFNQTVNRAVDSFHHKAPFYYYLITIWYSLAPWSLLALGIIIYGWCRKGTTRSLAEQFLMTAFLTTLIMLSVISSKIAIYLTPAFPIVIYLAMLELQKYQWNRWTALAVAIPSGIFTLLLPAMIVMSIIGKNPYGIAPFYICAGILTGNGIAALYLLYHKKSLNLSINTLAIGILVAVFAAGWGIPAINDQIGFEQLCTRAKAVAEENHIEKYYTYGIKRPESMDVFLGKDIEKVDENDILSGKCTNGLLIVNPRHLHDNETVATMIESHRQATVGKYLITTL